MVELDGYVEAKAEYVREAAYAKVRGVPLFRWPEEWRKLLDRFFPIVTCLCVKEEGCPCDGPIVWLPRDSIESVTPSKLGHATGQDVLEFTLAPDARVVVEQQVPMTAGSFVDLTPEMEAVAKKGNFVKAFLVRLAWKAGTKVGGWLDDIGGADDDEKACDFWAEQLFKLLGRQKWLEDL